MNPICWFEIYVQDMRRARQFYEAVFQVKLSPLPNPDPKALAGMEMWVFPSAMDSYGSSGTLVHMPGCPSGGSTIVYFACDDCATEAARAATNGGKIFKPKMPIGEHGFIALVHDPEGNLIGLHSQK